MGYYDKDLYNQPEYFGLTQIGHIDDPESCYSFDDLIVWQHNDGRIFYAEDSGCSCPSPFEQHTSLDDATEVTDATWDAFQRAVTEHCREYRNGDDPQAADKTELLAKVAGLLRARA